MKIDLIFSVNHTENSANHLSPFICEVANNTRILPSSGMCSSRVETLLSDIYEENKKFKKRAHDQRSESRARANIILMLRAAHFSTHFEVNADKVPWQP